MSELKEQSLSTEVGNKKPTRLETSTTGTTGDLTLTVVSTDRGAGILHSVKKIQRFADGLEFPIG